MGFVVDGIALGHFSLVASMFLPVSFNWLSIIYFFISHPRPMTFAFQTLCHLFIWMTYTLLYLYVHHPQRPALQYLPSLLAKNWPASIFLADCHYTGLFEMIVGVFTTCHTQNTRDSSICFFLFNRTTLQVYVTYLTGALYVHALWFYKHQHDNWVCFKLFVACQQWWFQWRFCFLSSVPGYLPEEEEHKPLDPSVQLHTAISSILCMTSC